MKIAVTGMPRCRTTEILNLTKDYFSLSSLSNEWGELQLANKKESNFIQKENIIIKLWPIYHSNIFEILKNFDYVVFSFTEQTNLWLSKVFNATLDNNKFDLNLKRNIERYSLLENIDVFKDMIEYHKKFKSFQHEYFKKLDFVYKTVFINDNKVFSHIHNDIDQSYINVLKNKISKMVVRTHSDYIIEEEMVDHFVRKFYNI